MFADEELQRSRLCDMELEVGHSTECRLRNGILLQTAYATENFTGKIVVAL